MPGDSHLWSVLIKVKQEFLRLGKFKLGDGTQVRFWDLGRKNNLQRPIYSTL